MMNKVIPFALAKDVQRLNERIKAAENEADRKLYGAAKELSKNIPYEKITNILMQCKNEINEKSRKKKKL